MSTSYNSEFYDSFEAESRRSASVLVPMVMKLVKPASVVDVGCGLGIWLSVFRACGATDVLGMDGDYVERQRLHIPNTCFRAAELSALKTVDRRFELAISLEVAEHLPPASSEQFVRLLVAAAPVIMFSAAIPGQPGTSHINPRWHRYWHEQFAGHGFRAFDPFRPVLWHDERVSLHYRQNIFLYAHETWLKEHAADADVIALPPVNCLTMIDEDVLMENLSLRSTLARLPYLIRKRLFG